MVTINDFQKNLSRRPLVEIISTSVGTDIPFDGQFLTTNEENETHPSSIVHSSGRVMVVFAKEPEGIENTQIIFKYTDTNRNEFQSTVQWDGVSGTSIIVGISMTELGNGNVGVTWLEYSGTTYYHKYRIVTETGVLVTSGEITNWTDTLGDASGPTVLRLG